MIKSLVFNIFRFFFKMLDAIRNNLVILKLKILYGDGVISFDSKIEKGCSIKCTKGSKLIIKNSTIGAGTCIIADHGGEISIEDAFIGRNCVIVAREKICIAPNCQIAEMVVIRDQNHNFGNPNLTIAAQGFTVVPISIENNVWLGAKVTVLAGSHIGANTVVGANAVVKGTLDANAVYVGVPVKKIKKSTSKD